METSQLPLICDRPVHPSEWPWWRSTRQDAMVLPWFILIHLTAVVGLILFPLPGWRVFLGAFALAWLGGIGTTVCYHRAIAHHSLRLNPVVRTVLIACAMFNGSGSPITWAASHRAHHAFTDAPGDVSSPALHGFWWAHLRWLWQAEAPSVLNSALISITGHIKCGSRYNQQFWPYSISADYTLGLPPSSG
jgi:fatty-acid desaturase